MSTFVVVACGALTAALAVRASAAQTPAAGSSEARAIAYLIREVPIWRREHPCYSCHNNGDAARALVAAIGRAPEVRPALDDTLKWLAAPDRWDTNGGGNRRSRRATRRGVRGSGFGVRGSGWLGLGLGARYSYQGRRE